MSESVGIFKVIATGTCSREGPLVASPAKEMEVFRTYS